MARRARGCRPTISRFPTSSTAEFPALGYPDSTDDIRGGAGPEGMKALYEFVQQGGTLITEGSTAQIFPNLGSHAGRQGRSAAQGLFARGTILRGVITDKTSPLVYGYEYGEVPVYFNSAPVLNSGQPAGGGCCAVLPAAAAAAAAAR